MGKKNKHLSIDESIVFVMDEFSKKTLRTKRVVYEMALRDFIKSKKDELIKLGISKNKLEEAINSLLK